MIMFLMFQRNRKTHYVTQQQERTDSSAYLSKQSFLSLKQIVRYYEEEKLFIPNQFNLKATYPPISSYSTCNHK